MNIEDLREAFKDILNRTDCTEDQVTRLMNLGLNRVQRALKLNSKRSSLSSTGLNFIRLPDDFLALEVVTLNGFPCQRVPITYSAPFPDCKDPVYLIVDGGVSFPNNSVGKLDVVDLRYFKKFPVVSTTGQSFDDGLSDLLIYASLVFAASLFVDDRKQDFEHDFQSMLLEVQQANDAENFSGLYLAVRNPYEGLV